MRISAKKISLILVLIVAVSIIFLGKSYYNKQLCQDLSLEVSNQSQVKSRAFLLLEKQIAPTRSNVIGEPCKNIDLERIRKSLARLPYIQNVQVQKANSKGIIRILVTLRQPLAKVYLKNANFYVDNNGYIFPISSADPAYIMVISSDRELDKRPNLTRTTHISQVIDTNSSMIYQALQLARYIEADQFLKTYITQIYVEQQRLELIPRLGSFRIIFGDISDYEKKFRNLKAFLQNIDRIGWNRFKSIDLSYTNQIVATKK